MWNQADDAVFRSHLTYCVSLLDYPLRCHFKYQLIHVRVECLNIGLAALLDFPVRKHILR